MRRQRLFVVPATTYGPEPGVTQPGGSYALTPGDTSTTIQSAVTAQAAGTTFWFPAGTYPITSNITPKTGNTFVGQYGAILDGSGWTGSSVGDGAFRSFNQDIDDITIRNLVIRNMPRYAITAWYQFSDRWTIVHNEIAYNKTGIEVTNNCLIQYNYIHHNVGDEGSLDPALRGGGYLGQHADDVIFEYNDISYNGKEQKVALCTNVIFRHNFVHHNIADGIWYDTCFTANALVEHNLVEDNGRSGIDLEAVDGGIIRNNTVRRHAAGDAIFLFRSQNIDTYQNTLEDNLGGIEYYTICETLPEGEDLANCASYDNTIRVSPGGWGAALAFPGACTDLVMVEYLDGTKNLTYSNNVYDVPNPAAAYWLWGGGGFKTWATWQALGHDLTGSVS